MPRRKNPESGFALLFVFAMSAVIAIMLYRELPSVTFEAQRDREQLLIDRGEQYSRAINLYVRKFNKYPADFDALDNTQNIRFLRRHYVDPMTRKDEWRLIHVGPGGVFTDSLVYNKPVTNTPADTFSTVLTQMQQAGGAPVDPSQQEQAGDVGERRRTSAIGTGGGTGATDPNNPNNTNNSTATLLGIGGTGAAPLLAVPGSNPANGQPGFPMQGGSGLPGQQGPTGSTQLPPGVQLPPGAQLPPGVTQAQPGQPGVGNTAANVINGILTSPRPGGFPGIGQAATQQASVDQFGNPMQLTATGQTPQNGIGGTPGTPIAGTMPGQGAPGQIIGGGIAGVASKRETQGIKVYNDRRKYNEWEFVYDASKDPARGGGAAPINNVAPTGTPANGATPATGTGGTQGVNPFSGLGSSGTPSVPTPGQVPPSPAPPPQ